MKIGEGDDAVAGGPPGAGGGARAVYSVTPEPAAAFEDAWSGFPCVKAGEAGGDRFDWRGIFSLPIEELEKAFTEEK